ncbi:hypothetical protein ACFX2I_030492 [Malus domestica]
MERYYKKQCLNLPSNISGSPSSSNIPSGPPPPSTSNIPRSPPSSISSSSQQSEATELDEILVNLPADPRHRLQMLDYPPNYREAIRRHYLTSPIPPSIPGFATGLNYQMLGKKNQWRWRSNSH